MRLIPLCLVLALIAGTATAKPPLREVPEIDDGLMAVAIADQIRKSCDGISARMLHAMGVINGLKARAKSLGYSEAEIDAYVSSSAEKARMRAKATAYLAARGVSAGNRDQLCGFGRSEIAARSAIGTLLR